MQFFHFEPLQKCRWTLEHKTILNMTLANFLLIISVLPSTRCIVIIMRWSYLFSKYDEIKITLTWVSVLDLWGRVFLDVLEEIIQMNPTTTWCHWCAFACLWCESACNQHFKDYTNNRFTPQSVSWATKLYKMRWFWLKKRHKTSISNSQSVPLDVDVV